MLLPRLFRLNTAWLLPAGVFAMMLASRPGAAQTPAHTPTDTSAPAPAVAPANNYPAMPAGTPAPASSLPSMPAATPQQTTPQQPATAPPVTAPAPAPSATNPQTAPVYHDPLEQPVVVGAPAPGAVPQAVPMPAPAAAASLPSLQAYDFDEAPEEQRPDHLGSTYIPVDSPIYPMALRLYSMGFLNKAVISMRPWTRRSLLHMLANTSQEVMSSGNNEAIAILAKLQDYLAIEDPGPKLTRGRVYGLESGYTRLMGIDGQTLRDSYHLGQTIANDYGRPYQSGFNNITGFSTVNEYGRFSLYVRGEYQHAPAGSGYSQALTAELSTIDAIPYPGIDNYQLNQATIPTGPIAVQNPFRLQEATLSFHYLGHEISGGKSDGWMGPGQGGAMAWSDNAEDIYSFRINRVEPLRIPYLSYLLGTVRYDFMVGSLKGHTYPNDPWIHSEMFAFRPTDNFEFGFQRSTIWGGHGHGCQVNGAGPVYPCDEPINLHTFFTSFFNFGDTENDPNNKYSVNDPGARFSDFSFSWRLPFMHHYVTLYTDSIAHDDVTPISAPRRAAYRPGVYISQFPGMRKLDFRVEAASTDTSTLRSLGGTFNYYETIQRQGYTNKGFIMGDWIGREAKGGQAWLTYHLSANEWIQVEYLNKKTPKDFIPGGTTQNQFMIDVVKRLRKDVELNAWLQLEGWKAPIYLPGQNHDTVVAGQVTWYPKLRTAPGINGK